MESKRINVFLCIQLIVILFELVSISQSTATSADFLTFLSSAPHSGGYDKRIFPRLSQNDAITCYLSFSIIALTKFDEVRGTLEVVGYLDVIWENELWTWTTGTHPFTEILLPQNDVWKPTIVLANSVESLEELGDSSYNIRAFNNGTMQWKLGIVATTGCFVDVSYYPFDKQSCTLDFAPWGYTSDKVSCE